MKRPTTWIPAFAGMTESEASTWHRSLLLALVAAACLVTFWFALGSTPLLDPDEGRHAEIAREMSVGGHWLTPMLNGRPYHDKPVLFYWLAAASMQVFGPTAWAVRLPSAVAATAGVLMTTAWGMRFVGPLTGTAAGIILATAGLYVGLGRFALLDMLFTCWFSAALFYASGWALAWRLRDWPVWPVYVFLALATLTKGPAAVVLAAALLALWSHRTRLPWRLWRPGQGALVFGVVAGAWYFVAAIVAPEYVYAFVWEHNVERFTNASVGHSLNILAYCYYLPATFLPWSLFWPLGVYCWRRQQWRINNPALAFSVLWVGVVFVFFTLSAAKLATYMLPTFPPLALLTAAALRAAARASTADPPPVMFYRGAFHAIEIICVGLTITVIIMGRLFWPQAILSGLVPLLVVLPLPLALGHLVLRQKQPALIVPTTVMLMLLLLPGLFGWFLPWLSDAFSLAVPGLLTHDLPTARRVFTYDTPPGSLAFYSQLPVQRLSTAAQAAERLSATEPTAIVLKGKRITELAPLVSGAAYVWWKSPRGKVLVVNRPPPAGSAAAAVPLAALASLSDPGATRGPATQRE